MTRSSSRVPVFAPWQDEVGPLLSLGVLTASARHYRDGALNDVYDIHRPQRWPEVLEEIARLADGPAILLLSNYVWSLADNVEAARAAVASHPGLLVIHGGPSTPKYEEDARDFLRSNADIAHVLVRGEGEVTLCEILEAWSGSPPCSAIDLVAGVPGLTYVAAHSGEIVRTRDRDRIVDLDDVPSPYLTGEFDHIPAIAWHHGAAVETNRGCPYGCSFCDWGSSTLSRIRKFDASRVSKEFRWIARHGINAVNICDANFGIMPRDVEIAEALAEVHREFGKPFAVGFGPAKNTSRYLTPIFDGLLSSGMLVATAISLQTTDEATLAAVARSNISTDAYLTLAAELRKRQQPLQGDLILGLPGQTFESYRADLQFMVDHEIMPRTWLAKLLPNAPMNAPEYRRAHGIETDEQQVVIATATADATDRQRMLRLRRVEAVVERYGLLRHVLRFVQWDHGIESTRVMCSLMDLASTRPTEFPLWTWVIDYFDLMPTSGVGPAALLDEFATFITTTYGVPRDSGMETVLAVQRHVLPAPQRSFPATIEMEHDYVAYYRSATQDLYQTGRCGRPERPLVDYPPATLTVAGDPLDLCGAGLDFGTSRTDVIEGEFQLGALRANELLSPLTRLLPSMGVSNESSLWISTGALGPHLIQPA